MNILFRNIPLTRIKILCAKILYRITSLFLNTQKKRVIKRNGINFEVDLTEGLDFSLFVFGSFQSHVYKNKYINLKNDDIIFDIGANIGIMALNFAKNSPKGKVYAFEPTQYALEKLNRNINLNPNLNANVIVTNCFISEKSNINPEIIAFSSWSLTKRTTEDHKHHLGTPMSTSGVPSLSMDDFVNNNNISRIDFIKVDTDGHEYEVFLGAKKTISLLRPKIIFELGLYVMEEKNIKFDFYWNYFVPLIYKLYDSKSLQEITFDNYGKHIPKYGSIDILAIPQ